MHKMLVNIVYKIDYTPQAESDSYHRRGGPASPI